MERAGVQAYRKRVCEFKRKVKKLFRFKKTQVLLFDADKYVRELIRLKIFAEPSFFPENNMETSFISSRTAGIRPYCRTLSLLCTLLFVLILIAGCSGGSPSFEGPSFLNRMESGDRHMGWSLNYFDSWRRDHQPRYLQLAEQNTISAIQLYSRLESDTSPRIREYYVVRERRTRGCRLLAELQFAAVNSGYPLRGSTPSGCTY